MELSHSLEDYLEAIYIIGQRKKVVRVKDLMNYFGYKVSSVNRALKSLKEKGLVWHEKYEYVELTPQGAEAARRIYEKHKTFVDFLVKVLKIPQDIARHEGCNFEHYAGDFTVKRLQRLIDFFQEYPEIREKWEVFVMSDTREKTLKDVRVG